MSPVQFSVNLGTGYHETNSHRHSYELDLNPKLGRLPRGTLPTTVRERVPQPNTKVMSKKKHTHTLVMITYSSLNSLHPNLHIDTLCTTYFLPLVAHTKNVGHLEESNMVCMRLMFSYRCADMRSFLTTSECWYKITCHCGKLMALHKGGREGKAKYQSKTCWQMLSQW